MDLQIAFELRAPAGTTPHRELYPAMLDMCAWADDMGFSYVNFGEHHVSDSGYNPSPLITCAAAAGRTKRIRMRPNVLLAPFYDPLRLAEDCAVLSLASRGRFDIALGAGYRPRECAMFGKRMEDRWAAVGTAAKVLRQAWTGEPFEYQNRMVTVRPVPDPRPKVLLGGGSEAAARANPAYQVLTPEQTIALGQTLGPSGLLLFNPLMGGIPVYEAWRMLRLFEAKVKPFLPV
jgi:alkanesulfonate monooxygenase SsuD/methylene tetrahydromethanopterin reductase-like flavin-dependent oxidoreductase (luciferase family)